MTRGVIAMLRHGESIWNAQDKFTGWTDVELSNKGQGEARFSGILLKRTNIQFDIAFTSALKRSIHTCELVLKEIDQIEIPTEKRWELNERHYGKCQGLEKNKFLKEFGKDRLNEIRRGWKTGPEMVDIDDLRFPGNDPVYSGIANEDLPRGETMEQSSMRVIRCFKRDIEPLLQKGVNVLVVAHGNSMRGLLKHIQMLNPEQTVNLNIPTAIPFAFQMEEGKFVTLPIVLDEGERQTWLSEHQFT